MAQLQTGWKRCALALIAYIGGAALHAAPAAQVDQVDQDKLALLSCVTRADSTSGAMAIDKWLNESSTELPNYAGQHFSGPLKLGKACLQNVTATGSFGVLMVQGEICNERLSDFTDALSAIGVVLGKVTHEKLPEAVLSGALDKGQYVITKGMIDLRTGKVVPTSTEYAFMCSLAGSGPQ